MKLSAHIHKSEDSGECLRISAQGPIGHSRHSPYRMHELCVPNTDINRAAFHIGRRIEIIVRPK